MEATRAVVVPDHLRTHFRTLEGIAEYSKRNKLRAAIVRGSIQSENFTVGSRGKGLGAATAAVVASGAFERIEAVEIQNPQEFFESETPLAEMLLTSAEEGAAWTLKYPHYAVISTQGIGRQIPPPLFRRQAIAVLGIHE